MQQHFYAQEAPLFREMFIIVSTCPLFPYYTHLKYKAYFASLCLSPALKSTGHIPILIIPDIWAY